LFPSIEILPPQKKEGHGHNHALAKEEWNLERKRCREEKITSNTHLSPSRQKCTHHYHGDENTIN
jgi:hypothetical protein